MSTDVELGAGTPFCRRIFRIARAEGRTTSSLKEGTVTTAHRWNLRETGCGLHCCKFFPVCRSRGLQPFASLCNYSEFLLYLAVVSFFKSLRPELDERRYLSEPRIAIRDHRRSWGLFPRATK